MSKHTRRFFSIVLIVLLAAFQCGMVAAESLAANHKADPSVPPSQERQAPASLSSEPVVVPAAAEMPAKDAITPLAIGLVHNVNQDTYYGNISDAVADANPGDTIQVAPGTYAESFTVAIEGLTIQSTDGPETTTISGSNPLITVTAENFQLNGFSFANADMAISVDALAEGSILIENCRFDITIMHPIHFSSIINSNVLIVDNLFDGSWRGMDFSQEVLGSDISISGNIFDIEAHGVSFGQDITDSDVGIVDNQFVGNIANSGYGIYINYSDYGVNGDSLLTIEENSFSDLSNGAIEIYYMDLGAEAVIRNNTAENCLYLAEIDYIGDSDVSGDCVVTMTGNSGTGLYGGLCLSYVEHSSTVDISSNTFSDTDWTGIYVYYIEHDAVVTIEENSLDNANYGIVIDYIGYYWADHPGHAYIQNNILTDCYQGISLDEFYYGTCIMDGNRMTNCETGIYLNDIAYDQEILDLQIINNYITISDDFADHGYSADDFDYGIYAYNTASVTTVSNNTIHGIDDARYYYGVYVDHSGYSSADPYILHFNENDFSECVYGAYFEYIPEDTSGEVCMMNNRASLCDYGIYIYDISDYGFALTVSGNSFTSNNCGLYIDDIDDYDEAINILIADNRFVSNEIGVYLEDIYLDVSNSWIQISGNDFVNNLTGLEFYYFSVVSMEEQIIVTGNNFSGNTRYAIYNDSSSTIAALNNWWGHPDGPVLVEQNGLPSARAVQEQGDPVSMYVTFDPWIASFELSPASDSAEVGTPTSFTGSIFNSEGVLVAVPGIAVRFDTTGANEGTTVEAAINGEAVFTYSGPNAGLDGVWATVVFGGEDTELKDSATMTWTGQATPPDDDPEEPLPNTGVGSIHLGLGLVTMAAGTFLKKKRWVS